MPSAHGLKNGPIQRVVIYSTDSSGRLGAGGRNESRDKTNTPLVNMYEVRQYAKRVYVAKELQVLFPIHKTELDSI